MLWQLQYLEQTAEFINDKSGDTDIPIRQGLCVINHMRKKVECNPVFFYHGHYMEVSVKLHVPATLSREKRPPPITHWKECWLGLKGGLDTVQNWKTLATQGNEPQYLGILADRHYTDWATLAHVH
jgi:hypothetical protein